jgi:hypothetical protein
VDLLAEMILDNKTRIKRLLKAEAAQGQPLKDLDQAMRLQMALLDGSSGNEVQPWP